MQNDYGRTVYVFAAIAPKSECQMNAIVPRLGDYINLIIGGRRNFV
jgi:hypothetical protein